jgi:UDP-glucose 4-epimerase
LAALRTAVTDGRLSDNGAFFFASSAGGLYAGSEHPPFDEATVPRPLALYGHYKLQQEEIVVDWFRATSVPTVIGRIANLYGPGQELGKPQGLISQLCRAHLRREPLDIYVPLDTTRDYIYAPDCARMIAAGLESAASVPPTEQPIVKVFASQRAVTIGSVLGELRRLAKRPPLVSLRASNLARFQVRDLRLRSIWRHELDHHASTPFVVGLQATLADMRARLAAGVLP